MRNHPKIKYFDLYGLREEKYEFLKTHDVKNTNWRELELKEPYYFFVPKNPKGEEKYQKFIPLKDIFERFGSGVITRRDNFVVSLSKRELENRMRMFLDKNLPKEVIENGLSIKDTYEWSLENARREVAQDKNLEKKYFEYLYRPFDKRWILYHENLISRLSTLLHQCFPSRDNLGLICSRKTPININFNHIFVSDLLADIHSASDQSYLFPLYLYEPHKKFIFKGQKHLGIKKTQGELDEFNQDKKPNIKDEIIRKLSVIYEKQIYPEEIFYYIYAILYSNTYRKKYNEFLKIDFPKIPFAKDKEIFFKMLEIGKELANLHLLKSEKLENPIASFPIAGDSRVRKREYNEKEKRVYINDKQHFESVEPEVWNYCIGGYQVLDKWLKDRIGGTLSPEDANHYLKIITALKYTIYLQKEIDKIYPEAEKKLLTF